VIQGHDTTVPVTMDEMVYHTRAVSRGMQRPLLMADMPFMSYPSREEALTNAARLMREGGAEIVKLESGAGQIEIVEFLARHDIAVCAHLGLKPQSVHKTGGFRVQGREKDAATRMIDDAKALADAGADLVLLECVPNELGQRVTEALSVPVIGIGAGPAVDGQILVLYDVLDITIGRKPRFVRNFIDGAANNLDAIRRYVQAVKSRDYPGPEHGFS
jgi:3-methyl-2-oxobutanoate hydroxymethyltransferase